MANSQRIQLVIADVDGTLVTQEKILTQRAIEAVGKLRAAEIRHAHRRLQWWRDDSTGLEDSSWPKLSAIGFGEAGRKNDPRPQARRMGLYR
jgi:phosphoglycolate phosphatase-like HAD superfamily hydrolase